MDNQNIFGLEDIDKIQEMYENWSYGSHRKYINKDMNRKDRRNIIEDYCHSEYDDFVNFEDYLEVYGNLIDKEDFGY